MKKFKLTRGGKDEATIKVDPESNHVRVSYPVPTSWFTFLYTWCWTTTVNIDYYVENIEFKDDDRIVTMRHKKEKKYTFTCPSAETYTIFKFAITKLQNKARECKKRKEMCMEFLHIYGRFREGEEEKYDFYENTRLCTESDRQIEAGGITYSPPAGWYQLKFNVNKDIPDTWDYGYHGTKAEFVGSIMRNGFIKPGEKTATGTLIKIRSGHIPGMRQIYTSPSLRYAGHYVYAQETEFHYTQEDGNEKTYYVRAVFQVRQKPGTYHIQGNTLGLGCWDPRVRMDDAFTNDELERYTADSSTVIPVGLLLHFSEIPPEDVYAKIDEEQRRKYSDRTETTFKDSRAIVQTNFAAENKKKILWVDDYPPNNTGFIETIRERGVEVDLCLSTDSAVRKVLEEGSNTYCIAITDMRRTEQREGDDEPKVYNEAGLDFIRIAKSNGWEFPIYLYSSYARKRQNVMHAAKEAGAEKVCTHDDISYIIEEEV